MAAALMEYLTDGTSFVDKRLGSSKSHDFGQAGYVVQRAVLTDWTN
jgi:hypothetical protein